ncbi:hypothetical protein TSUD_99870 [Trifolium subterraneum]|uniref:Reverse transcriptase domain-containing protein n=1 Tax=Trifolium subterraneum TaxID=3900 RepID=A0A2Z6PGA4_TRISU|nr:hypothetical protein TSUD_99870 [Trifolium subterraneum]
MDGINLDNLNIDEEEALNFELEENSGEQYDVNLCMVGRFIHDRPIKFNIMKARLADVWRPVKGMVVKEATQGLYLFQFFHPLDVEEVIKGGPWLFDNYTLVIDRMKVGVALHDIPLYHVNFWVQIHNVPVDNKCEVKYAMERDDGSRGWSNEIKAEVRRPGGRVESRWLREERSSMGGVHTNCHAIQRESQSSGSSQANETQLRPRDNGSDSYQGGNEVVVAGRSITPSMSASMGSPRPNHELSLIPPAATKGRSGGLAVFWKDSSKCEVVNYTRNFINMIVKDEQWGEWMLTCYYGFPERSRRRAAWDLLRELRNMSSIPWCIIGDFNDLLSQADKKGIHPHPNGLCMGFRQAVSDCDLTDIPIEGHPFTWIKSRERLDRAMASASWLQLFPQNSWLKEPDLEDVVVEGWGGRENLEVVDRVTRCANKLQMWGKRKRVRFKEEIDACVRRMNELRGNQDGEVSLQYQELSEKHATLLIQEEGYWKQRAKMHWLQEGDMNTRFFHMSATARSKKKKPRDGDHDPVLNLIHPRVTDDDNFFLTAPITEVEIQQALFHMHPDKSPGPDGFNPAFYQRFWEHCSDDIFSVASTWFKCCLDKCVSQEQSAFVKSRSILDNALIATEVIHALKRKTQEVIHALKRKTQGRRGELTLKIDISKAYDKVDWGFLRGVMTKMGFTDVWIRWVMMCVSSVNYSVLMNYDRVGPISPGRGLRQGDPLSPYLFILVTECLTALIHQSVGRGDIHGVRICRGAPGVSHLLFADDCFLFCRANVVEVNELMSILHTYERASGQEINLVKSEVFISRNMSHAAKEDLSRILSVRLVLGTGIYLGLPSMVGRSKKAIFSFIKDRIWKRINSWRGRALSKAGKEIMIKSVLQAISSYVMSMFILPKSLIDDIEKNDQCFLVEEWWRIGSGENIRVMHDPWLRGKVNKWVSSPQPAEVYQLSVRDLLHENYKAWNIAKVRNLFSGDAAERILETPLVNSVREDKVVWEEERNGCYSVKSGYKLAMRYIIGSDKYHLAGNWNGIWKAQAPHKARHLLWRLCRGCLPTCYRLLERRVECNLNCPVCDDEIEDEIHIFFRCAVARDSWCAASLSTVLYNDAYQ